MLFIFICLGIILFTKELIVINPEFIVIIGFITIFFILKSLTQELLVESFDSYADQIRKTYLSALYTELNNSKTKLEQAENNSQLQYSLAFYYEYLLGLTILFFDKIHVGNMLVAIENANANLRRIFLNISQLKKATLGKSLGKSRV